MSKNIEWLGNQIKVEPPKKPKKITATRFGAILGLNVWSTPFAAWCEITKTYEKPFKENKYTLAGKIIEPKIIKYVEKNYFEEFETPTDIYGKDYFNKTRGDFYPDVKILGGMWDAINYDTILEVKTTSRAEDWFTDIPEYYALQGALYGYLSNIDNVIIPVGFLDVKHYDEAQALIDKYSEEELKIKLSEGELDNSISFEPTIDNVLVNTFKISERYPNMKLLVGLAIKWWQEYIETGISPVFNERKDAEILKELRTTYVNPTIDLSTLCVEWETLNKETQDLLEPIAKKLKEKENRIKIIEAQIKDKLTENIKEDTYCLTNGNTHTFKLTKKITNKLDEAAIKKDKLYDKYVTRNISYTLTKGEIK